MLSRRQALLAVGIGLPAGLAWPAAALAAPDRPDLRPRSAWATGCPVKGPLLAEDVKFLLVHHTLTPNTDKAAAIPARLRSVYAFHTQHRGWNDVAYNFFVDAYGTIWEGRQGSIAGPVRGDATGGSQGFAQLACFVGDFTKVAPTPAAMTAMTALLAWLAHRSGLSLTQDVTFTSRGSSRWRAGARVTTPQIAAHRDMSQTDCPGDALYPLVASRLLPDARARLGGSASAGVGPSAQGGASVAPESPVAPSPSGASPTASAPSLPPSAPSLSPSAADGPPAIWPLAAGAAAAAAALGGGIAAASAKKHRHRRETDQQRPGQAGEEPHDGQ